MMGIARKRKVSLFDVVDDSTAKTVKTNGGLIGNNRWNGKPYSPSYFEILEKRKTLPVWHQKDDFLQFFKDNQILILVGETGSGKTTQLSFCNLILLTMRRRCHGTEAPDFFMHVRSIPCLHVCLRDVCMRDVCMRALLRKEL